MAGEEEDDAGGQEPTKRKLVTNNLVRSCSDQPAWWKAAGKVRAPVPTIRLNTKTAAVPEPKLGELFKLCPAIIPSYSAWEIYNRVVTNFYD